MRAVVTHRLRPRLIALLALATIAGAAAAASPKSFSVEIAGGRVKGEETLKVRQGDQVQVRFTSDQPVVLHLHGYDIDARVAPPAPALMAFTARLAGRFPVHEHRHGPGNHRAVLFIEVHP
jgi:FtsP/CotA-like multicopper oxidase with cupredoxin domain